MEIWYCRINLTVVKWTYWLRTNVLTETEGDEWMNEQQALSTATEQHHDPQDPARKMVYFAEMNPRLTKVEDDESVILNTLFYKESPH